MFQFVAFSVLGEVCGDCCTLAIKEVGDAGRYNSFFVFCFFFLPKPFSAINDGNLDTRYDEPYKMERDRAR